MSGSYKVNVMAMSLLEVHHEGCKLAARKGRAIAVYADVVILAENTLEITVGEKDCP
jgi:hypothetical protein